MEAAGNYIKILVVGEAASIHAAKFVSMLQKQGHDVRLFSNSPNSMQDELLKQTVFYNNNSLDSAPRNGNTLGVPLMGKTRFIRPWEKLAFHFLKKIINRRTIESAPDYLLHVIHHEWRPDIVISLKMQNDGYVVAEAKAKRPGDFPPWIHFIWGTDIEFFGKDAAYKDEHLPRIKHLLSLCDYILADTHRDIREAAALGFRGKSLGKLIAQGGFNMDYISSRNGKDFAERKAIVIKGRHGGLVGKAMNVLEALHGMKDEIRNYEIKFIMSTPDVRARAAEYSATDGIAYDCPGRLSYTDLMDLFGRARIAVSATDIDGTPGFLLESMAMGALPVHSDMESIREWIRTNENGLLFPVDDIETLKAQIRRGLSDAALFEKAYSENLRTARETMDEEILGRTMTAMIKDILGPGLEQNTQKMRQA